MFTAAVAAGLVNKRSYNVTIKYEKREQVALFAAAILVAIGGIIYELILGAAASYLVGDSILSFSLATGVTLFGMGIGSLLVNYIKLHPATSFATNELFWANWWKFGDADVFGIRFYAFALADFCRHKFGNWYLYRAGNSAFNEDVSGVRA